MQPQPVSQKPDIEFWRISTVTAKVGLSKSEIYRRVARDDFPAPRPYPGSKLKFWLAHEVRAWQAAILGDDFDGLLG